MAVAQLAHSTATAIKARRVGIGRPLERAVWSLAIQRTSTGAWGRDKKTRMPCALRAMGIVTALGHGVEERWPRLAAGDRSRLGVRDDLVPGRRLVVGEVRDPLPAIPDALRRYACRTSQLALAALRPIEPAVRALQRSVGEGRVAVVVGTSTSGVAAAEQAIAHHRHTGALPAEFDCVQLEQGG